MSRTSFRIFALCALLLAGYIALVAAHDVFITSFPALARYLSFMAPHQSATAAPEAWLPGVAQAFRNVFRVIGFLVSLCGVVLLLGAVVASRGVEGYFKGGLFIVVGSVIARIALT